MTVVRNLREELNSISCWHGRRRHSVIAIAVLSCAMAVVAATVVLVSPDSLRLAILRREANLAIIDVRPTESFAKGHIQGAQNIPAAKVTSAGLPLNARIVVYCGEPSCPLSTKAANDLVAAGYTNVSHLEGGFAEWLRLGYPATTGDPTVSTPQRLRKTLDESRANVDEGTVLPLDVRPKTEFLSGHLPHALNAPLEELESHYNALPKDKEILIYDRLATRSHAAFDKLKAAGFTVSELSGGFVGWVRRNHPVEVK